MINVRIAARPPLPQGTAVGIAAGTGGFGEHCSPPAEPAGHASAGFIARLEARLQSVTADEATRDTLRALARRSA